MYPALKKFIKVTRHELMCNQIAIIYCIKPNKRCCVCSNYIRINCKISTCADDSEQSEELATDNLHVGDKKRQVQKIFPIHHQSHKRTERVISQVR